MGSHIEPLFTACAAGQGGSLAIPVGIQPFDGVCTRDQNSRVVDEPVNDNTCADLVIRTPCRRSRAGLQLLRQAPNAGRYVPARLRTFNKNEMLRFPFDGADINSTPASSAERAKRFETSGQACQRVLSTN
jgi:hypothetical protein